MFGRMETVEPIDFKMHNNMARGDGGKDVGETDDDRKAFHP